MKTKLFVAVLSLTFLSLAVTPVDAVKRSDADANLAQMQADTNRVDKLRHGYIKYKGNRMYYYW